MRSATRTIFALVSAVLLLAAGLAGQKTDSAQALLRAATDKAVVDGDLNGAIKQYQTIVEKFKTDRAVVATALVRMAECYQKLGDPEAQKAVTTKRVFRGFGVKKAYPALRGKSVKEVLELIAKKPEKITDDPNERQRLPELAKALTEKGGSASNLKLEEFVAQQATWNYPSFAPAQAPATAVASNAPTPAPVPQAPGVAPSPQAAPPPSVASPTAPGAAPGIPSTPPQIAQVPSGTPPPSPPSQPQQPPSA